MPPPDGRSTRSMPTAQRTTTPCSRIFDSSRADPFSSRTLGSTRGKASSTVTWRPRRQADQAACSDTKPEPMNTARRPGSSSCSRRSASCKVHKVWNPGPWQVRDPRKDGPRPGGHQQPVPGQRLAAVQLQGPSPVVHAGDGAAEARPRPQGLVVGPVADEQPLCGAAAAQVVGQEHARVGGAWLRGQQGQLGGAIQRRKDSAAARAAALFPMITARISVTLADLSTLRQGAAGRCRCQYVRSQARPRVGHGELRGGVAGVGSGGERPGRAANHHEGL